MCSAVHKYNLPSISEYLNFAFEVFVQIGASSTKKFPEISIASDYCREGCFDEVIGRNDLVAFLSES